MRGHGGPRDAELRALAIDPARLLDLSVNTNPYGPCPEVLAAIAAAPVDRYPDPTGHGVREAIAPLLDVPADHLALGNGAADLLWTLARALRPARALIVEPTFVELRAALEAQATPVVEWRARAADDFAIDLDAVGAAARPGDLVYLCAPNTPTGVATPAAAVAAWAAGRPQVTVVLDQSFLSLSARAGDAAVAMPPSVVRVRSLTKDHAIPGVRIGYLIGAPALVTAVEAHRPAWTTGAAAQAAALAACRASGFVATSRDRLLADRAALDADLRELGLAPVPSTTGFTLVRVGAAGQAAEDRGLAGHRTRNAAGAAGPLRARLLARHHVLVRDCASFGLPEHVRIAARPAADRARLRAALREELPCLPPPS